MNINIEKKHLYIISAIIGVFAVMIFVMAYGGTNPAVHGHSAGEIEFPSGAIIAFDTITSCPSGWTQVAAGKVIVGLNTGDADFDNPGDTGGEKTHTLTTNEMPSHSHSIPAGFIHTQGTPFLHHIRTPRSQAD